MGDMLVATPTAGAPSVSGNPPDTVSGPTAPVPGYSGHPQQMHNQQQLQQHMQYPVYNQQVYHIQPQYQQSMYQHHMMHHQAPMVQQQTHGYQQVHAHPMQYSVPGPPQPPPPPQQQQNYPSHTMIMQPPPQGMLHQPQQILPSSFATPPPSVASSSSGLSPSPQQQQQQVPVPSTEMNGPCGTTTIIKEEPREEHKPDVAPTSSTRKSKSKTSAVSVAVAGQSSASSSSSSSSTSSSCSNYSTNCPPSSLDAASSTKSATFTEVPSGPPLSKKKEMAMKRRLKEFDGLTEDEIAQKQLPDHLREGLDMVIIGINPSLAAAHVGQYYAGPGNHFWTCVTEAGLVPPYAKCHDDHRMLEYGIGFTNVCSRPTRGAADLSRKEMKEGSEVLLKKLRKYLPKIAVFNGKGIYESFIGNKNFYMGKQPDPVPGTDTIVFVMPSSSARCAQLPRAADKLPFYKALKKLRDYVRGEVTELDDSVITFPDYTEMRVTQPDPKSIMKAERRRKRKAELAAAAAAAEAAKKKTTDEEVEVKTEVVEVKQEPGVSENETVHVPVPLPAIPAPLPAPPAPQPPQVVKMEPQAPQETTLPNIASFQQPLATQQQQLYYPQHQMASPYFHHQQHVPPSAAQQQQQQQQQQQHMNFTSMLLSDGQQESVYFHSHPQYIQHMHNMQMYHHQQATQQQAPPPQPEDQPSYTSL